MKNDMVSIIVPVYNCEKYLEKCINSLINQTYINLEIILVNDGSTDSSYEICKKYENQDNIIIINKENFGAPSARNEGLKKAQGEYIIFFDSDDYMELEAVEKMHKAIKEEDSDIVIGVTNRVDEKDNFLNVKSNLPTITLLNTNKQYFTCDPFPGNKMYKKSIIKKENIRFANVKLGQDLNFYLKYLLFVKKVTYLDNLVSNYRIVYDGISRTQDFRMFDIVDSLKDVDKFYKLHNEYENYEKILNSVKVIHYNNQMAKNNAYNFTDRNIIINYFKRYIKLYINSNLLPKDYLRKLNLKIKFSKLYGSRSYFLFKKICNKFEIVKEKIKRKYNLASNFGIKLLLINRLCRTNKPSIYKKKHKYIVKVLKKRYDYVINKYKNIDFKPKNTIEQSNTIWFCWWQGIENAPEIVKKCYNKILSYKLNVILITKDNYKNYTNISNEIINKFEKGYITITHFSDILRFNLLNTHGGLWLDSTIYVTSKKSLENIFNLEFFTIKHELINKYVSEGKWVSYCIGGKSNNILFDFMNSFFEEYWKNEKIMIDYFLVDYIIKIAYEEIPEVNKMIGKNKVNNKNVHELSKRINKVYNENDYNEMVKDTYIYKLSYKQEFIKEVNGEETYYNML